jgi:hypothetical protein
MGPVSPQDQISYLQLLLLSILMNDEFVKMRETELLEHHPDATRSKVIMDGTGWKGNKGGLSARRIPNLVLKRDKNKGVVMDGDMQMQSNTLISASATSADIAKIVADWCQVLSFSESNLNLKGYKSDNKDIAKNDKATKSQIKALQKVRVDQGKTSASSRSDGGIFTFMEPEDAMVDDDDKTISTSMSSDSSIQTLSTTSRESSTKVPTLVGSSRDSSSIYSNQRKNKLLAAVASSKQERILGLMNGSSNSSSLPYTAALQRLNASPRDNIRSSSSSNKTNSFNPFISSPEGKPAADQSNDKSSLNNNFNKNLELTWNPNQQAQITDPRSISTNNQLVVTFAINEDLSCNFQNSSLVSSSVQGVIQVQAVCKADLKCPILVTLRDPSGYIQLIDRLSPGVKTYSVVDGVFRYNVALPQWKEYFPIIKYKCHSKLKPDPLVRLSLFAPVVGRAKLGYF